MLPKNKPFTPALMLMLHAGYPCALEGMSVLARAWPGAARRTRDGGPAAWRRRGGELCARVYGASYARLVENVRALHPDLAVMMIEQGYGRVLSRAGRASALRMPCLAWGGMPRAWARPIEASGVSRRNAAAVSSEPSI